MESKDNQFIVSKLLKAIDYYNLESYREGNKLIRDVVKFLDGGSLN